MKILPSFEKYCDAHCPFVLDLMRILLGVILFYKGILFVNDADALNLILNNSKFGGMAFIVEHHVAFTLLAGGIMIAIGFLTRIAIAFELLIFVGVILNQGATYGLYSVYSELGFAIVVSLVLFVFLFIGPGPFSADHYISRTRTKNVLE